MSKLLIQDDILEGLDVYVEYTSDTPRGMVLDPADIILYDYGLELDAEAVVSGGNVGEGKRRVVEYRHHVSLRGYKNTRWMEDKLCDFIMAEEGAR